MTVVSARDSFFIARRHISAWIRSILADVILGEFKCFPRRPHVDIAGPAAAESLRLIYGM